MIELVSATRLSPDAFWSSSALGKSLSRLSVAEQVQPMVMFGNEIGLPYIFNSRIPTDDGRDVIVFIHDDVWIDDFFFVERIHEGLEQFDVIGVAGNRRRVARQPSWALLDRTTRDDRDHLSGVVAHGSQPFGTLELYGEVPAACELLDGVFLATRKSTLVRAGVRFDPRFQFHFYDLDFCRSCRGAGLRLGTWPICLTHQSRGNMGSDGWLRGYEAYLGKWGD